MIYAGSWIDESLLIMRAREIPLPMLPEAALHRIVLTPLHSEAGHGVGLSTRMVIMSAFLLQGVDAWVRGKTHNFSL